MSGGSADVPIPQPPERLGGLAPSNVGGPLPEPPGRAVPAEAAAVGPVTILGRGRVGRSLGAALAAAGIPVALCSARDESSFARGFAADELIVLAVPDDAIAAVAERVRAAVEGADGEPADGGPTGNEPADGGEPFDDGPTGDAAVVDGGSASSGPRPAVVHLSGASGFAPIEALGAAGIPVGILHPFAPFPEAREPAALRGVTFGVAASTPVLLARIEALADAVGGVPRRVAADGWVAYHAAGVMASNYLVVLAAQASALLEQAGFDRDAARDALGPLMRGTLENLAAQGIDNALSGPLRRGDLGTVESHLIWLDDAAPDIAATYRTLARPGIDLAVGTGLSAEQAERLRRVLR